MLGLGPLMKFSRLAVLSFLAALAVAPLAAQTTATAPKQVPVSRTAWINSRGFFAEETGIKRLVRSVKELELEFSGTESELNLLSEKLRTIVTELQKLQGDAQANAQAIQDKQAEGLKLQQELQGKQQAAQQAVQQAQQTKQGPIMEDIRKSLEAYAKERQIGTLLDLTRLGEAALYVQPDLDVTEDFIAYFNASHP
jgi:Skp family chaperone for outer membrane proteins